VGVRNLPILFKNGKIDTEDLGTNGPCDLLRGPGVKPTAGARKNDGKGRGGGCEKGAPVRGRV